MTKKQLLQGIVTHLKTITAYGDRVFLFHPHLDLDAQTHPFAVVRSITDIELTETFDDGTRDDILIWVYVYPIAHEYEAIDLAESTKQKMLETMDVSVGPSLTEEAKALGVTVNRLNGDENVRERYGSVLTCTIKLY